MQNTISLPSKDTLSNVKLTDWKREPTVLELTADLQMAQPTHDAHVNKVKHWIAIKDAKKPPKKANSTRSSIQPKLVRKSAEWRYPALSEPFLASEKTFQVDGVTWEDKKSANHNELILNKQFRTKVNPVKFIDDFVRTTVDEGTCVVKVGWVRHTKKVMEEVAIYEFAAETDPQAIEALKIAATLLEENPQGFSELPEDMQESVVYSIEAQQWATARAVGTKKVAVEKITKNQPVWDIVNYENFYLDPNAGGHVENANFAIISFETSKAKLKKDGRYKNLDQVNWSSNTPLSRPDHTSISDNGQQFSDELRKVVVAYEYWGFYDINATDELIPFVATWIGNTMIRMELNPFPDEELPIVVVNYLPVKDSVTGEPDAELLEDNQAIIGALTRGMIDLMGRSANGQIAFAKGSLDTVNRKRYEDGKDYEYNPGMDPQSSIYQHKYPEIPGSALNMLAIQNQEAEALTGVKAFSGGMSGEAYGEVAAGIRGLLDAASKREMSILRRLAQGMSEIGRKTIAMNGVFLSKEETIEITNEEYIKVSREDLAGEFNTTVKISTPEIEESQSKDLGFLLQTLGNTVPWEITQMILSEITRLKRMPTLSHALMKYKPQPDPLQEKRKELEIAKIDAEIAEIRSKIALNAAKTRAEEAGADQADLDFIEQETGTKHARDMERQSGQAESNMMADIGKRIMTVDEKDTPKRKAQDVKDALQLTGLAKAMS